MDKRFLSFLWSALLVLLIYSTLQQVLVGPRNRVPPAANPGAEPVAGEPDVNAQAGNPPANADKTAAPADPAEANPAPVAGGGDETPSIAALGPNEPSRRFTLGSLDAELGDSILVTLSNRGATVERVELSSARYTDVDDRSGYLGELGLGDDPAGGCRVTVVGAGTPASLATCDKVDTPGLLAPIYVADASGVTTVQRPGDLIKSIDEEEIHTVDDFTRIMSLTRPGQKVRLGVQRSETNGEAATFEFAVKLRKRPLAVLQPEPYVIEGDIESDPLSFRMTLHQLGDKTLSVSAQEFDTLPSLKDGLWKTTPLPSAKEDGSLDGIEFHYPLDAATLQRCGVQNGNIELVKRYRLKSSSSKMEQGDGRQLTPIELAERYELILELELRNLGTEPLKLAYALDGPTGLPLEGWWYSYKVHPSQFGVAGIRDIVFRAKGASHEMVTCASVTKYIDANPKSPQKPLFPGGQGPVELQYIGGDAQFFSAIVMPQPPTEETDPFASATGYQFQDAEAIAVGMLDKKQRKRTNVSVRLVNRAETVAPGGAIRHRFAVYTGPKDPDLLDPIGLGECIVYGWFKMVARPMVGILHGLYWLSGSLSYGVAIVLLTVLVRSAMYPLGRKMALNAQKMQELAPELKKIADQHKDDMEKRGVAQRELFRKHKYNPLSGCLVMFFQLPVFVGLYRALSVDIRLRQAPLIPGVSWCSNLAGPDRLWHWQNTFIPEVITKQSGIMGPYLNILPFFSFALMMVHQKMFTPPPQDDQQKMQMQVMNVMMVFFAVMFHKVAAGLCIYFIVSSLWGLGERLLLGKYKRPGNAGPGTTVAVTKPPRPRLK